MLSRFLRRARGGDDFDHMQRVLGGEQGFFPSLARTCSGPQVRPPSVGSKEPGRAMLPHSRPSM
jgi:hypothetical protein